MTSNDLSLPIQLPVSADEPFTAAQAQTLGVTHRDLARLVETRHLVRLFRGVYVSSAAEDTVGMRAQALSLVVPPGCFAIDRTAAWLHGAPLLSAPDEEIARLEVCSFRDAGSGRVPRPSRVSRERSIGPGDLTEVNGIPVTTPLRTAWDLGRLQPRDLALAGLDAMARVASISLPQLVAGVERFRGMRGVVQLRELAPLVDPGSESLGESALRLRWHDAGLPRPETQIPVLGRGIGMAYLDLGIKEWRAAAEYDSAGFGFYSERDAARRAWAEEECGYQVAVFTRAQVFGSRQDAADRLRAAFGPLHDRRRRILPVS